MIGDLIQNNLLATAIIVVFLALAIELCIAGTIARRKERAKKVSRSTSVHLQDGTFAVGDRDTLLSLATDLRIWLNRGATPEDAGTIDTLALVVNTLVSRAVPGARWDAKTQRYALREKKTPVIGSKVTPDVFST